MRTMNILDVIKDRRGVREFKEQEIPESAIDVLIEALRWAPSAGNLQSRQFYFVFNEAIRNKLVQTGLRHDFVSFITRAPLVVVACADLRIASGDATGSSTQPTRHRPDAPSS